jgi:DNA-binding transcriptional LysR family regulator
MIPFELHQLEKFLAVYRLRSVTKAAQRLNLAQPSITRALQELEVKLGGKLFTRPFMHPTQLAVDIVGYVREIETQTLCIIKRSKANAAARLPTASQPASPQTADPDS